MLDFFDAFQQGMLNDAVRKADAAKRNSDHTATRLHLDIQHLESKIDGLALICEALWEVLRDHTNVSEEELHAKIREIDLRDGRRDGKFTGTPTTCRGCGRPGHTRQAVCMYCRTCL